MAETGRFYVYELIDPRDDAPFYVGKGQRLRAFDAKVRCGETLKRIHEIEAAGLTMRSRIVSHFTTEQRAYEFEAAHIARLGIKNLTNVSRGGYGRSTIGARWSEFARDKEPVIPVHLMDLGVGLPS